MSKNYRAELTGVFGDPVDGNPTGVMEEAAFEACGLNYRYLTIKVTPEGFDAAIKAVRPMHMKGLNLTMPHKIAVLPYLDELSEAVSIIGAVNTILVREDGTLFGENTDGKGFVQAMKFADVTLENKKIVILGAGGAAKAIAVECALAGASAITIVNRTETRAQELCEVLNRHTPAKASWEKWTAHHAIPDDTDILINATCIGLHPYSDQKPDIDYDTIKDHMVLSDVVFNPSDTLFLQEGTLRGAKVVSGLGMLACQGALNFTLWTGVEAPLDVMMAKLKEEFAD